MSNILSFSLSADAWLYQADCRDVLRALPADSIDSCVCDPPYHLTSIVKRFGAEGAAPAKHGTDGLYARQSAGFMGKIWDGGDIAFDPDTWVEVLRVLKPGAHLVAFGAPRGYHRMACAIEDAGFEIRDSLMWIFGTGFPKSHNVSKGIDKAAGAEREVIGRYQPPNGKTWNLQNDVARTKIGAMGHSDRAASLDITAPATQAAAEWEGWETALKPAFEPIILARKPLSEKTVAANVLKWRTGAINIDACRVPGASTVRNNHGGGNPEQWRTGNKGDFQSGSDAGRWPANVCHDGSQEVVEAFPSPHGAGKARKGKFGGEYDATSYDLGGPREMGRFGDEGSAARFFYNAKANKTDRAGSKHPTVKPVALISWLAKLITPPGGVILDPFAGSGTTGQAAIQNGFKAILVEREAEYVADIQRRMQQIG